ncbi:hypothetical protein QBC40DRAFT_272989 [Triangularia verruculosa]|uniref:Uncharacterized protein n=1 Tax=Triangularia verruculosa TaxID=2587418 RepID=A0AAN6XRQ1_9PEZI|nr:hypothetical protein QBC40DRAFT_272989 [Triangularia verruculosa]
MNTVKSFWVGLGSLCVAGGSAYYFAKQGINADKLARLEEKRKRNSMVDSLEYSQNVPTQPLSSSAMGGSATAAATNGTPARTDAVGSPSLETGNDPAPTRHAPATEAERLLEKSKYEASVPFRSRKGDRFS